MQQVIILVLAGIVGALGITLARLAPRLRGRTEQDASPDVDYHEVIEQSPNGVLIADAATGKLIAANPAMLDTLGYMLEELRELTLAQVFTASSEDAKLLSKKLRDPNPRMPLQVRQRRKDGSLLDVEVSGHRVDFEGRRALAF